MTNSRPDSKLAKFYAFFESYGTQRLNGLGSEHFVGLNASEKEEAWNFLEQGFESSEERIAGLYTLDKERALPLFKDAINRPMETSQYPAEQRAIESCRLLMLKYVNNNDPNEKYVSAMCQFARSAFKDVRAEFAQSLPIEKLTAGAVEALKGMIFTETETIPLSSAITKFMVIHGMDFDRKSQVYKSIYLSLRSDDVNQKLAGMKRLEQNQSPDYIS